jgi:hypothetical protein
MEPEGSLPCSQKPSTGPTLSQMNSVHTTPSYVSPVLKLSFLLRLYLPNGLFPSGFPTKILYEFLFSPCALRVLPISSSLTWWF